VKNLNRAACKNEFRIYELTDFHLARLIWTLTLTFHSHQHKTANHNYAEYKTKQALK